MNLIRVKTFPDSPKQSVEQIEPYRLRVFIREAPKNNQANKKVLLIISEFYEIPVNKLRILTGHRSPNKIIQILED
jgi:hypothetical protein